MSKQKELSGRESDLIEVVFHLLHINTEIGPWHREWAKYHLMRATQGLHEHARCEGLAGRLHDAFDELVGTKVRDAG